ncbi:hypothetical protein BS78_05G104500 [Paspalum vaginatum]|nr:hypothetical protein BS78_05G104500 [Paspalum vaginatum]
MFTRKIVVIVVSAIVLCNPVICMAEECTHRQKNEILRECQPLRATPIPTPNLSGSCCAAVRMVKDMNMLCIYLKLTLQEKRQYDRVKSWVTRMTASYNLIILR